MLYDINVNKLLEIVNELKQIGWTLGVDFDFSYHKAEYDDFSHIPITEQHAKFSFYNDSNASYFILRWG
jgi:hypothetical protein